MLARMITLGGRGVMLNNCDGSRRMYRFVAVDATEDGWVTDFTEEGNAALDGIEEETVDDDSVKVEGNGWDADIDIIEDYFVCNAPEEGIEGETVVDGLASKGIKDGWEAVA